MTLVLNEIHIVDGLRNSFLVAAADRRVSKPDGTYDSTRRKLFLIPHLNGTISYYGLACVYPRGKQQYLSEWLPNFIRAQSDTANVGLFAEKLRDSLHNVIKGDLLRRNASGFHIFGYNNDGYPEFWHLTNVGGLNEFKHIDLQQQYKRPSEDFLARDARVLGWNGTDPSSVKNAWVYRNGDFRLHVVASDLLDQVFSRMNQFSDFRQPGDIATYGKYVKFKFEVIAFIYKEWADKKIIARPIDVIVVTSGGKVLQL